MCIKFVVPYLLVISILKCLRKFVYSGTLLNILLFLLNRFYERLANMQTYRKSIFLISIEIVALIFTYYLNSTVYAAARFT